MATPWVILIGIACTGAAPLSMGAAEVSLLRTHDVRVFDQWDGMPYFAVSGLATTADGRLWLATFRSLVRYDGIGFEPVGRENAPEFGLFAVQTVRSDRRGRLWLGGGGGIAVMEKGAWRFFGPEQGMPPGIVRDIAILPSGEVWAASESGVVHGMGDRFESVPPPHGDGEGCRFAVTEEGSLWCATPRGIWRRDGEIWQPQGVPTGVAGQAVCGVTTARGDGIWVAWEREVWRLRAGGWEQRRKRPASMSGDPVTLLEDGLGGVWVGGWNSGLARLDADGNVAVARAGQGLASSSVTAMVEDAGGNIWVGCNGGFLARVRPLSFESYGSESGLGHLVNTVAEETPGVLVVGTHGGGLLRWRDGRFERHPAAGLELGDGTAVGTVLRDSRGELWVGTPDRGLLHGQGGRWEAVPPAETGARIIHGLHEDRRGRLWVGTAAGIAVREQGRFRPLTEKEGAPHMVVQDMAEDVDGRMWFCGIGYGLFRADEGRIERVEVDGVPAGGPFATLAAGRGGTMWVGLPQHGVARVRNGRGRVFGSEDGLVVDDAVSLMEDDEGQLWIWTNDRCQRIAVASFDAVESGRQARLDVRAFDRRDGLPGAPRAGWHPVVAKGTDGRIWWATVKGVTMISPSNLPKRVEAPGVVWRWIRDGLGDRMASAVSEPEGLEVGRAEDVISVGFRSARFGSPEHVRYECRLLPNGTWHGVLAEHRIVVPDLRPGQYRLEVRASEREGEWGTPAGIHFWVPTPWWQRGWVNAVALVGITGFTAGAVRGVSLRRVRRRLRQLEQDTLLERERTRIARNLHDDLGASMTRMALLLEKVARVEMLPSSAREGVTEGLNMARGTIESLDAAVWAVNPANDSLGELVGYLGQMVVDFCESAGWEPVLDLPERPEPRPLGAEWRHHVVLIVKEAVHNAIKHSGGSRICMRVATRTAGVDLIVDDDGCGPPDVSQLPVGEGNGLGNLRSRASSLGGYLSIGPAPGGGTRVSAFIPWPT